LWSDEEIQILKDNYPTMGAKGVVKLLPNRNTCQIAGKANSLGVLVDKSKYEKQKELVLKEYKLLGLLGLKDKYPDVFNGSSKQIYRLVSELGLSVKMKKQVVCVELGRAFSTLQEAANFAHVKFYSNIASAIRDNSTSGGYHWKYVEEGDENKDN
jgi:hypothetical protein